MQRSTYVLEEIVHTVNGDFAGDRGREEAEDFVELVAQHVEDGHTREDDRCGELPLHHKRLR